MPSVQETELVGKKQDISDVLIMSNAAEMPFVTMVKKGKRPKNTLVEYPIDKYDDANSDGVPFNQDVGEFDNTQENRDLLHARVMRQWRNPMVDTAAQEVTEQAGDEGDKFAQSRAKTTIELKQDMEKVCLGQQDSRVQSGGTPARTRGMGCWTNAALQTVDLITVVPAAFRPAAAQIYLGNLADYWEDDLRGQLQARYETVKSRGNLHGFVGTSIKSRISDFSRFEEVPSGKTLVRRFNSNATGTIDTEVSIYKGDYGMVTFHPDLFTESALDGELVDMNRVELRPTTLPRFRELENRGAGRRGINETLFALVNTQPAAHCTIQMPA